MGKEGRMILKCKQETKKYSPLFAFLDIYVVFTEILKKTNLKINDEKEEKNRRHFWR